MTGISYKVYDNLKEYGHDGASFGTVTLTLGLNQSLFTYQICSWLLFL